MNKSAQVAKYLVFDFLAAAISWTLFFIYRKTVIEPQRFGIDIPIEFTTRFYLGLIIIPIVWITGYYISGFYKNIFSPFATIRVVANFHYRTCWRCYNFLYTYSR